MLNESLYEERGEMMDRIQKELTCCGVLGVSDWESRGDGTVPASCCVAAQCDGDRPEFYQAGCLDQMEFKIFKVYFWSDISLLAVLSYGVIIQLCLLIATCFPGK